MIRREIEKELFESANEYPTVTITGPRQSGKTTLARAAFPEHSYVSFEQPLMREQFRSDPLGFLKNYSAAAIFDEVQQAPELLSYLQPEVDDKPDPGRFILTGSQNLAISEKVSQSLAGRTALLELLPFSLSELQKSGTLGESLDMVLWQGAYPPVHDRKLRPQRWYGSYMATYIDRDVRQLSAVQNLETFHRFIRLLAGNVGQLLNCSRLAGDCGVDHKTVRHWIDILQAGYVAHLLPPYYRNIRKRVVKTPKIFFFDTGLVCHLLGINEPEQLENHPLRGQIFENWVFAEIIKHLYNGGLHSRIYFWRTHGGQEVDFLLENSGRMLGIEVKAGMTPRPSFADSLLKTLENWYDTETRAAIIYGGEDSLVLKGCDYLPWQEISRILPGKG